MRWLPFLGYISPKEPLHTRIGFYACELAAVVIGSVLNAFIAIPMFLSQGRNAFREPTCPCCSWQQHLDNEEEPS